MIDLGLERGAPDLGRGPQGGGRPRLWSRAVRRRWAFAGCLALVLLAAAGAAPPPQPSLFLVDPQPPASVTGYAVAGDQLYVLTGDPQPMLSAYHLPDGRPLWSTPASSADFMVARRTGDVVLVLIRPARGPCCEVAAYDGADGEVRWSRRASVVGVDTDDNVVALAADDSTTVVDMASGRVRWEVGESAMGQTTSARSILLTYRDGTAERRDLSTGEVQATGRVHPPDAELFAQTTVDSQLIVGYTRDYQSATIAAYNVDTLALSWRRVEDRFDGMERCGRVVCVRAGHGLEALDPRTGTVRWQQAGWYALAQGDQLLAVTPGLGALRAIGVVDPLTGRVLLDLRLWQVHASDSPDPELVLTRAATGGRTIVAVVDLVGLTVEVIGAVPGRITECQPGAASLACRGGGGELQLWAYRG